MTQLNSRFQAKTPRLSGLQDGEVESVAWDIEHEFNTESSRWKAKVKQTIPHIEEDEMYLLHQLKQGLATRMGRLLMEMGKHLIRMTILMERIKDKFCYPI